MEEPGFEPRPAPLPTALYYCPRTGGKPDWPSLFAFIPDCEQNVWIHRLGETCPVRQKPKPSSFVVVQLPSHVRLFATPWTAARRAPLSFTVSQSFLRFMSIESVILSLCLPPLSPFAFSLSQHQGLFLGTTCQPWSHQSMMERVALEQHSVCMCAVTQSYLTLCDPLDWSPPGSSVHGISQARILQWAAVPFSRGSSLPRALDSANPHWQADSFPMVPPGKPGTDMSCALTLCYVLF